MSVEELTFSFSQNLAYNREFLHPKHSPPSMRQYFSKTALFSSNDALPQLAYFRRFENNPNSSKQSHGTYVHAQVFILMFRI